jgi:hypothetical protein
VVARQPAIDRGDQRVPIAQEIEADHGRDHQERDDVEDDGTAGGNAGEQARRPFAEIAGIARQRFLQLRLGRKVEARTDLLDPGAEPAPARLDQRRQGSRQAPHLALDHRHQEEDAAEGQEDEEDGEQRRRQGARGAAALQPVGQRIEQIGDDHAGDERHEHVAEQPEEQHENGKARGPGDGLASRGHGVGWGMGLAFLAGAAPRKYGAGGVGASPQVGPDTFGARHATHGFSP